MTFSGGLRQIWTHFYRSTSNQGFAHIGDGRRKLAARVFWSLLYIWFSCALFTCIALLLRKYFSYPVHVDTSLLYKNLPFPAVTLCNASPFRSQELEKLDNELAEYQRILEKLAQIHGLFADTKNESLTSKDLPSVCSGTVGSEVCRSFLMCANSNTVQGKTGVAKKENKMNNLERNVTEAISRLALFVSSTQKSEATTEGVSTTVKTEGNNDGGFIDGFYPMCVARRAMVDMQFLLQLEENRRDIAQLRQWDEQFLQSFLTECTYDFSRCDESDFVLTETKSLGTCYTFNSDGKNSNSTQAGSGSGLSVGLAVSLNKYLYTTPKEGVTVSIHAPQEYPFSGRGTYLATTRSWTSIALRYVEMQFMSSPYGMCLDRTYAEDNLDYDYDGHYTAEGCFYTCVARRIVEQCQCAHYMYPLPKGDTTVAYCDRSTRSCAEKEEGRLLADDTFMPGSCGCYDLCGQGVFQTTVSHANAPSAQLLSRVVTAAQAEFKGQVQLEVFYESLYYQQFTERSGYTVIQLLSDMGGQMGLWVGVSVFSLVEFLSLFTSLTLYMCRCVRGDIEMRSVEVDVERSGSDSCCSKMSTVTVLECRKCNRVRPPKPVIAHPLLY